ncbi:hypothetical protein [Moheibacter sediminis]|uniref:Dihaem cytochrome c n=1 Tax=Moheibacter sediminis TaxID=1434700 RepID=A0A1W2CGZ0_9FLAO|nr:hypothetical protein [Moheibacter sediminis]SMC84224.1 hypothetical protein SAMN06296427_11049 [Moheibacter sediminis]
MSEILKTFGFILVVLFIVSCATKVANTIAHTDPVPSKSEVLDAFSSEQLAQGQAYFEESCTRCHKLFEPSSRDAEKWNNVLKRMLPKTELTQEESRLVRAYLIANSK